MATATRRRAPPKKKQDPRRWIINGKVFREEDLPAGVKHPRPSKAKYYVEVDLGVLKSIKTPHMVNRRTKKRDLADGVPVDAVLSYTDRGLVMKDMYALETRLPHKSKKRDRYGDRIKKERLALVGSEQKIYYRDVEVSEDPDHPFERTIRIPHGLLAEPMWRDWRASEGVPVGREPEFQARIEDQAQKFHVWLEPD